MATTLGKGQLVSGDPAEGVLREANSVQQVFALLKADDLDEAILLVDSASATVVAPLMAKVRGIVCRSGGMTSHLAIVSREFGLPCVVAAELSDDGELDGVRVRLAADGSVERA